MSDNKSNINRRDFLKYMGVGAAALSVGSCKFNVSPSGLSVAADAPIGKLDYRYSKTHNDRISLLGYGCMRLPKKSDPKEGENICDQELVNEMIDENIKYGVNYFDTAPPYMQGWSETCMGEALCRHPRDSYYIATKMSNMNSRYWSREASIALFERSFVNLKTDYIDYYLLHTVGSGGWENFQNRFIHNGILDFLIEQRAKGRIRNLGFSFHGDVKVFDYLLSRHDEIKWDFAQIQVNYKDWHYANETKANNIDGVYLYTELEKRDIDVIIMEPILGGRLARIPGYLANILQEHNPGKSLAWWAFRYAASFPKVVCVLSGINHYEHLYEDIEIYSPLEPMTQEENDILMEVAKLMIEYPIIECTACQYCMPCPYGVDIPSVFTHFNKCVCEGNYPESSLDSKYKEGRRAFLIGYDRSVPKLRQANHCINCNECVIHCPQRVDIPAEMRRVDEYVEKLKQETL